MRVGGGTARSLLCFSVTQPFTSNFQAQVHSPVPMGVKFISSGLNEPKRNKNSAGVGVFIHVDISHSRAKIIYSELALLFGLKYP